MSSTNAIGRKETERNKLIQEKCQTLLTQMLRDEDNKYCVDCDAKGPRWASWNLGVFLCIRCAGIHRNLGVHISRVKSVNLDTWTPEQVISLQQMGNSRARAVYEAQLPDGFRRPQTDTALESFIRAKYEHKKYLAREWVPPSPPKVDWAKEIDEELERQKRKKKAAQVSSALGLGSGILSSSGDNKKSNHSASAAKSSPLPAPLPKPKPNQAGSSPKTTQRISTSSNCGESDLLGLSSPTKPVSASNIGCVGGGVGSGGMISGAHDLNNDSFSSFLSATTTTTTTLPNSTTANGKTDNFNTNLGGGGGGVQQNSLAQEEQDFFNQGSLGGSSGGIGGGTNDRDKSGKLSKDSILALYGTQQTNTHNLQQMVGGFGGFTGMAPGYMPQQQQQPPQQHQFMTPPNSVSMYNSPVMTAPNAFSAPSMNMNMGNAASVGGFGAFSPGGNTLGGFGATTNNAPGAPSNINLMQTNQSLLSGMSLFGTHHAPNVAAGGMQVQPQMAAGMGHMLGMNSTGVSMQQPMNAMGINTGPSAANAAFQTPNAINSGATANLNQQFGNLNIGNVWQ